MLRLDSGSGKDGHHLPDCLCGVRRPHGLRWNPLQGQLDPGARGHQVAIRIESVGGFWRGAGLCYRGGAPLEAICEIALRPALQI